MLLLTAKILVNAYPEWGCWNFLSIEAPSTQHELMKSHKKQLVIEEVQKQTKATKYNAVTA